MIVFFLQLYSHYSDSAHSESLSTFRLKELDLKEIHESIINSLQIILAINCVCIVLLKNKFECAEKIYKGLDDYTKAVIRTYYDFGVNEKSL